MSKSSFSSPSSSSSTHCNNHQARALTDACVTRALADQTSLLQGEAKLTMRVCLVVTGRSHGAFGTQRFDNAQSTVAHVGITQRISLLLARRSHTFWRSILRTTRMVDTERSLALDQSTLMFCGVLPFCRCRRGQKPGSALATTNSTLRGVTCTLLLSLSTFPDSSSCGAVDMLVSVRACDLGAQRCTPHGALPHA